MDMMKSLLLILHLATTMATGVPSCNSPVFCKTKKVKYMSMSEMPQAFLNVSTMAFQKTTDIASCQRLCLNQAGCFSLNINIATARNYVCNMLSGNIYSNASRLVKNTDFVHLFIQSPCMRNPCKNDGVCIPNYKDNTYSCSCKHNDTFKTTGSNCETLARGLKSANFYWTFDGKTSDDYFQAMRDGAISVYSKLKGNTKVLHVPERPTPVTFVDPSKNSPIYTFEGGYWPCLNTFDNCPAVTYNVWVRFTEEEASQDKTHVILYTQDAVSSAIGINFRGLGKKGGNQRYSVNIRPSTTKKYALHQWGTDIQPDRWNNFIITFSEPTGICAYVNGKMSKCSNQPTTASINKIANRFKIGYQSGETPTGMFVDDLAIWKAVLSAEQVKEMYEDGA